MRFSSIGGLALLATLAQCSSLIQPVNITAPGSTLNYTYSGCWTDGVNGQRSLNAGGYTNGTGMTDESCVAYCYSKGYNYAGTEYSSQCCKSSRVMSKWLYANDLSLRLLPCQCFDNRKPNRLQHGLFRKLL